MNKHLIDFNDFTFSDWRDIIESAIKIEKNPDKYFGCIQGKILATLFYEPSTRTQMSFQTAMQKLGGQVIGFDNPQASSVVKGENLKDTIKVTSNYADIIVIRHPSEGAAKAAATDSNCPVINAGDGGHLHPTQTLTDLVTLSKETGRLSNLTIGVCGDLKYGRTVHSLVKAMINYPDNRFVFISTPELSVPDYIKDAVSNSTSSYEEVTSLSDAVPHLDVLYMTRIQRERFLNPDEYEKNKSVYILDSNKLKNASKDLKIMHPLPRTDEISIEIDDDPRAIYFKQANYGLYARMALIINILSSKTETKLFYGENKQDFLCKNENCITNKEVYLKNSFTKNESGEYFCEYCDRKN